MDESMISSLFLSALLQVQMSERASEVTELKQNLAQALRDKEQLQEVAMTFIHSFICVAQLRL